MLSCVRLRACRQVGSRIELDWLAPHSRRRTGGLRHHSPVASQHNLGTMSFGGGLRADGRRENEIRRLRCSFGAVPGADGSCAFGMGGTRVMAAVFGPVAVDDGRGGGGASASGGSGGLGAASSESGSVHVGVSFAAAAQGERRVRGRTDRLVCDLQHAIRSTVEGMMAAAHESAGTSAGVEVVSLVRDLNSLSRPRSHRPHSLARLTPHCPHSV